MKDQHVNTEEAVQIHEDIKSKSSLGIHWGTFSLSFEVLKCIINARIVTKKQRMYQNCTDFHTFI